MFPKLKNIYAYGAVLFMYKRQYIPSTMLIDNPVSDFKSTLLASKAYAIAYTTQDLLYALNRDGAQVTLHYQPIFACNEANWQSVQKAAKAATTKEYYYGQVSK